MLLVAPMDWALPRANCSLLGATASWSFRAARRIHFQVRAVAMEQQMEPHPITPINIDPGVMDTDMQAIIRASSVAGFPVWDRFIV